MKTLREEILEEMAYLEIQADICDDLRRKSGAIRGAVFDAGAVSMRMAKARLQSALDRTKEQP